MDAKRRDAIAEVQAQKMYEQRKVGSGKFVENTFVPDSSFCCFTDVEHYCYSGVILVLGIS